MNICCENNPNLITPLSSPCAGFPTLNDTAPAKHTIHRGENPRVLLEDIAVPEEFPQVQGFQGACVQNGASAVQRTINSRRCLVA